MSAYDEDLLSNRFIIDLRKRYPELYAAAASNRWTICVPKREALLHAVLTEIDFKNHIIVPSEHGNAAYRTVSDKLLVVHRGTIITGKGFQKVKAVPVLFEETFFNDSQQSYRVICVMMLLEGGAVSEELLRRQSRPSPYSLSECRELLWGHGENKMTQCRVEKVINICNLSCDKLQGDSLVPYIDAARSMFFSAMEVLMRDRVLKNRADSDGVLLKIKIAIESYTMHSAYRKLFRGISSYYAVTDAVANKVIRNLSNIQIQDLKIAPTFCDNLPRARRELSDLVKFTTPMGKLLCIRRVVMYLMPSSKCVQDTTTCHDKLNRLMTTDDLLPLLMFIIIKSNIANWSFHLCYMSKFRFSNSNNDDEFGFYVTSMEAALEYLMSGQVKLDQLQSFESSVSLELQSVLHCGQGTSPSENLGTKCFNDLLTHVRTGDVDSVRRMLDEIRVDRAKIASKFCHPLCSCDYCEHFMSYYADVHNPVTLSHDQRGCTPLHVAAAYGHASVVELLVKLGGDVTIADCTGSTPLHFACRRGHQNVTLILLHFGADPEVNDSEGNTALQLSATHGHDECVKALLYYDQRKNPVNVNIANDTGDTPLHNAARWGFVGIIRILLEAGASIKTKNNKKLTPVNCAHSPKTVEVLLGMNEKKYRSSSSTSLAIPTSMKKVESKIGSRQVQASTGFVVSNGYYHPEHVNTRSPNRDFVDRIFRSIVDGDSRFVYYLLQSSSESESEDEEDDQSVEEVCHPLCQCCKCARLQKSPLSASRNMNCFSSEGLAFLHVAVLYGRWEIVGLLLKYGADVDLGTAALNVSALHIACRYNKADMVKLLIHSGARIDRRDSMDNTPLHFCAMNGCAEAAQILFERNVSFDICNSRGDTPLHESSRCNMLNMIQLLLQHGAPIDIRNGLHLTPVEVALTDNAVDIFHSFKETNR